ncbi:MAG: DUF2062 domain-containing protein [Desulfoarculaceae bacterium]|nr:DUF2062 domain-containing protein [Desulfoarculaceae bacterium]
MNIKRRAKYFYLKFRRQEGDPRSLAFGTAIGVFIGFTPTVPLHTILIVLSSLVTRTSIITAMLANTLICNPFTYVPLYYLATTVGNILTPYELTWDRIEEALDLLLLHPGLPRSLEVFADLGYEAVIVLVVGGTVLALPCAIVSYFLSLHFFLKIRQKRRQKHTLTKVIS